MTYHVLHPGEWSVCAWEEWVFFWCWGEILHMSIITIWSIVLFKSVVSLLIFCLDVLSIIESGVWSLLLLLYCYKLLPSDLSNFLYIFRCSNIGCVYSYNCYILLLNWPFYHIETFFISRDSLDLKCILSDISIGSPASFSYHLHGIFFPSFYFQPMCVLKSKVTLL